MFGGGATNPYDDVVAKTTDENLTTENWELIMNLCDKVSDEGDEGAHNAITSLLKRLAHRNPNVQLYALTLAEALSKNCGVSVNREIASRAFTQGLEKLITDRTTHDKVRKRALGLIAQWTAEFEEDPTLGVMEDCYNNLKSKGYKFETPQEPVPPTVDDEIRRKEEEELQRVLEMSMQDRGGRDQWAQYSLSSSSGAGGSSTSGAGSSSSKPSGSTSSAATSSDTAYTAPKYQGGYAPARTPSPQRQPAQPQYSPQPQTHQYDYSNAYTHSNASNVSASSASSPSTTTATASTATATASGSTTAIVTRVRALHTFEPTEPGELAFEKGDIIKVVDRGYKDWWRGQLKGRTGIFPVNYVEPMPEPTAAELAREAEQEAAVFAQAVNVEKLLSLLRAFDPTKDNLADNEEIQELYRSSMALRPKIVKLIDKYSQKRADLVSMNETFVRARTIFDRMMEESLARHTGVYDQPSYRPSYSSPAGPAIRPDSRTGGGRGRQEYVTSPVGGAPAYGGYGAVGPVGVGVPQGFPEPQPAPPVGYGSSTPAPGVYGYPSPQPQPHPQIQPLQPQGVPQHQHSQPPAGAQPQPQSQPQPQPQPQPGVQQPQQQPVQQPAYSQMANAPYSVQGPTPYPAAAQQSPQTQPQAQAQPQPQAQAQPLSQPQQYGQSPYPTSPQPGYEVPPAYQPQPQQQQPAQQLQQTQQVPQAQSPQAQHAVLQGQPQAQAQQPQVQPTQQVQPQHQQSQPQPQPQPLTQAQPAQQPIQQQQQLAQTQPAQSQPQPHQAQQAQPAQQQQQHQPSTQSGPPYIFDPTTTYADPNVQAWAQYYAQGGRDLAGSVYFVSIPGLTDGSSSAGGTVGGAAGAGGAGGSGAGGSTSGGVGVNAGSGGSGQQGYAQPQQQPQQSGTGFDQGVYGIQSSGSFFDPTTSSTAQQQRPSNASSTSLGSGSGLNPHPVPGSSVSLTAAGPSAAYAHSPTAGSSTPSWVLPKKDSSTSPHGHPRGGGNEVQGLSGRFAGVSLTDPGSASA